MLKVEKLNENQKTKYKKVQTKNKGITLIALVITIIVILILAGVSINTLFGDNGLLTKADEAREANSHAQVKDELQLEIYNYEMESRSGSTGESLIQYLGRIGYLNGYDKTNIKDSYTISEAKLKGVQLGKGTDKNSGDVYVIEKGDLITGNITKLATVQESDVKPITKVADESSENKDWVLRYYKTATDYKTLLNLTSEAGTSTGSGDEGDPGSGTQTVVKIPDGYTASTKPDEDSVSEGLVIKNNSTNDEFVWIEVPKKTYKEETKTEVDAKIEQGQELTDDEYKKIENDLKTYSSTYGTSDDSYYEECGFDSEEEYNEAKNKMLKSVYKNGGFWIGRYEAGVETARSESDKGSVTTIALSQPNKYPYNWVTCSEAQKLASEMPTSGELTSSLMFGVQWNLVCKFFENTLEPTDINSNSGKWGNYNDVSFSLDRGKYSTNKGSTWTEYTEDSGEYVKEHIKQGGSGNTKSVLLTTGASDRNCKLNIYDLAGNEYEWTLEKSDDPDFPCTRRGGSFLRRW